MASPRMNPSGTVDITTHQQLDGRLRCYGYGQDDRAINPGDLMIVGSNWLRENHKLIEMEFALRLRGRDIAYFIEHALLAGSLYKDNEHWLSAPASQPGVDMRSMSAIRTADNAQAIKAFYERSSKSL